MESNLTGDQPILLAFSGGLDTSFCVPWLKETHDRPVVTVTVDTGGIDAAAAAALEERSQALGAADHVMVDAKQAFFDQVITFLIMGNVRRGHLYPLCVGAERGLQAQLIAETATRMGSQTVAHGCTAAGNDQVRFEVALRTLGKDLTVLAPVRDHSWARESQIEFLEKRNLPVPAGGGAYSINRGLWGVTIGGQETLDSASSIPEDVWPLSANALTQPVGASEHTIGFDAGVPVSLDNVAMNPVELTVAVEALAAPYGIGRGVHLGDTILGTKGRVAFEAPAAEVLLTAHRELEKLTMTGAQQRIKDSVATWYGELIHEGKQLEPACRDIEALISSSQKRVSGTVTVMFHPGHVFVAGAESPHSLMAASRGAYGEAAAEWTAADALGFSKLQAVSGMLYSRADTKGKSHQ